MKKWILVLFTLSIALFTPAAAQNCGNTSVGLPPINDLGAGFWHGEQGGLYPNGQNSRPFSHDSAGIAIANQLVPLDGNGNPDPVNGKIVLLSIGMSNANQEYEKFQILANSLPNLNPYLEIVQGAQPGRDISAVTDSNNIYWSVVDDTLTNRGLTRLQVRAVWFKQAERLPQDTTFPSYAFSLRDKFVTAMNILQNKFPNLRLCYLASRIYAGYAVSQVNPEPFAYYSGWSVKFMIRDQINGDPQLDYHEPNPSAPWLSWGPYIWADGLTPRSDGLIWECPVDYLPDGMHPSDPVGRLKVANMLLQFFTTDATTVPWFLDSSPTPAQFQKDVTADWNLLGLPLDVTDGHYLSLFPTALPATLFGWNRQYLLGDTLHPGEGYWLRFPFADSFIINGFQLNNNTITLSAGWNMITGISCDVALTDVSDPQGIIIPGTLTEYSNNAYVLSDTIRQGVGYWLRANAAGQISLSCSGGLPKTAGNSPRHLPRVGYDFEEGVTLRIGDASGASQHLTFDAPLPPDHYIEMYSLPPLPPPGSFDARFAEGYRLLQGESATIELRSSAYPITVAVTKLQENGANQYQLAEWENGKIIAEHVLTPGLQLTITNPTVKQLTLRKIPGVPKRFVLEQNYPNPFNPLTIISYQVTSDNWVTLKVYDLLGRKVKTLVNKQMAPGRYTVRWDGTNDAGQPVSSGVYLYRIETGGFSKIKKMVLLR